MSGGTPNRRGSGRGMADPRGLTSKQVRKNLKKMRRYFAEVPDPRGRQGRIYPLELVLSQILIGMAMGLATPGEIAAMANGPGKGGKLRKWLGWKGGRLPSQWTIKRVMAQLKPEWLACALGDWTLHMLEHHKGSLHIAVDGKAIRALTQKARGSTHPPYLLNAFIVGLNLLVNSRMVGEKTNEIGELPAFLECLDLEGNVVTADAMATHGNIMRQVQDAGGYFVFAVKNNQKRLNEALKDLFASSIRDNPGAVEVYHRDDTKTKRHGRREFRTCMALALEENPTGNPDFDLVRKVAVVIRTRIFDVKDGDGNVADHRIETQTVYYVSNDSTLTARKYFDYILGHWAVEDSLHYVIDNTFHEDRSTMRSGNLAENMSILRKAAYNMISWARTATGNKGLSFKTIMNEFRDNF